MRRFTKRATLVLAAVSLAGCLVTTRHGHLAVVPPPAVLVAGAITAAAVATRPGWVWVEGHWDWVGGRYRPGRWKPVPRVHVPSRR